MGEGTVGLKYLVAVTGRFLGAFALLTVISDLSVFDPRVGLLLSSSGLLTAWVAIFFLGIIFGVCSGIIAWTTSDTFWRRHLGEDKGELEFSPGQRDFDWEGILSDIWKFLTQMARDPTT